MRLRLTAENATRALLTRPRIACGITRDATLGANRESPVGIAFFHYRCCLALIGALLRGMEIHSRSLVVNDQDFPAWAIRGFIGEWRLRGDSGRRSAGRQRRGRATLTALAAAYLLTVLTRGDGPTLADGITDTDELARGR